MSFYDLNLQRKQELEECLLEMMQEIPYREITVKMLTEKMEMARKTFYHYFPSKQACLESLTDRLIYECGVQQMQTQEGNSLCKQTYVETVKFWMAHKVFLDVINRNSLGAFFLNRMLMYLSDEDQAIQKNLSTDQIICDADILFFYISGYLFLILKWSHEGFPLSVEEMAQKLLRLIHEPLVRAEE